MANTSVAQPTTPKTTREQRGLQLWRERGDEVKHVRGSVWAVPSCSGEGVYLSDVDAEVCTCPDTPPEDEVCKHVAAATIARAKTGACVGCGGWFDHRTLIELNEDNHDNLTYFHGDQLCQECAIGHGII